jgi:hypothetical protein
MAINFTTLVNNIILEQEQTNIPITQYIIDLLKSVPEYKLSIPENVNEEVFFSSLIDLAWRIKYGTGYSSATNAEISRYRTFWPIVDFFIDILNNVTTRNLNEINFNLDLNTLLSSNIAKTGANIETFKRASEALKTPQSYNIKERRINDVKFSTGSLAGEGYKNKSPLNAVLDAVKVVKGYNEREVADIMKYPRKYDLPASIKLQELMPIRKISQALYLFYVNKLKNPIYLPILQTLIPEFAGIENEKIITAIDGSIGLQNPQNRTLQNDYELFLNGKSKLLVKIVAESLQNRKNILNELSSADIAAGRRRTYSRPQNNTNTNNTTANNKTWKPTETPIVQTIKDFTQGAGIDQQVEDAYNDFYNSLTKGSTPSKWQKAGNMFSSFMKGLEDVGSALEKL